MYVKELDIFLTMKVLENTPAVLSLGKLCDENGKSRDSDTMQHGELCSYRGIQACQRVRPLDAYCRTLLDVKV